MLRGCNNKPKSSLRPSGAPGRGGFANFVLYNECNLVERFYNKLKQFRRVATRYDESLDACDAWNKLAAAPAVITSIEIRKDLPD